MAYRVYIKALMLPVENHFFYLPTSLFTGIQRKLTVVNKYFTF